MNARLTNHHEHQTNLARCAYTPAEAAKMLGVSESTIRNAAKKLGVRKIAGPAVAAFVRFASHPVDVSMPVYSIEAAQ